MKGRGRTLLIGLLLLALLAVAGCGSSESGISTDQVVENALTAQAGVTSSHLETKLVASLKGILNGAELRVDVNGSVASDADWANKRMRSQSKADITYAGIPTTITAQTYAVDNYSYTQVTGNGASENWTKEILPVGFWYAQSNAQLINALLQYAEPASLTEDAWQGTDCYRLTLSPDYDKIGQDLTQFYPEWGEIPHGADVFEHLSVIVWVAQDTSYVIRIEVYAIAHATPESFTQLAAGDAVDINMTMTIDASKLNQPVSIELPAGAQNAVGAA